MSLQDAVISVLKALWWLPLPFLAGKVVLEIARKLGRYRNMR